MSRLDEQQTILPFARIFFGKRHPCMVTSFTKLNSCSGCGGEGVFNGW